MQDQSLEVMAGLAAGHAAGRAAEHAAGRAADHVHWLVCTLGTGRNHSLKGDEHAAVDLVADPRRNWQEVRSG